MSSAAQITANQANAQFSTGPRTAEGKAISSRNAVTLGLYTAADLVRPEEREEYEAIRTSLWHEINPAGMIEETFASSVLTATWRLRRCSLAEADLAETTPLDPMFLDPNDPAARTQLSIDRARNQAHTLLRRSLAELRLLQTERAIREQAVQTAARVLPIPALPALASQKQVLFAVKTAAKSTASQVTDPQQELKLSVFNSRAA